MLPEEPVLSEETIFLLSEECDEEFFISKLIENAKKLKIKTSVGKFELKPGERKQII